jgi:hypothetical protein
MATQAPPFIENGDDMMAMMTMEWHNEANRGAQMPMTASSMDSATRTTHEAGARNYPLWSRISTARAWQGIVVFVMMGAGLVDDEAVLLDRGSLGE